MLLALLLYRFYPDKLGAGRPEIHITEVPPYDIVGGPNSSALIKGEALGVDPEKFCVLVYTHVDIVSTWYVQPQIGQERLKIINGTWGATIHTGTKYAALLVRDEIEDKNIPSKTGNPSSIRGVVAIQIVPGKQ